MLAALHPGASVNRWDFAHGFTLCLLANWVATTKKTSKSEITNEGIAIATPLKSNRSYCGGERLHAIQIVVRILARIVADPRGSYFQGHRARSNFQNLPLPAPAVEDPWKF